MDMMMNDLVERYIHQVGIYLPRNERTEIQAELRSQIADELEDRFGRQPREAEIVMLLQDLGDPRRMAVSYSGDQSLIGAHFYPIVMMVLRRGCLLVTIIALFLNVFWAFASVEDIAIFSLLIDTVIAIVQVNLMFFAVVVLIFALVHRDFETNKQKRETFKPQELRPIDDPTSVDSFDAASNIMFSTAQSLMILYWLNVGGLTLRFSIRDISDAIPFPQGWMLLLLLMSISIVALHVSAVLRTQWRFESYFMHLVLNLVALISAYFAVMRPVFEHFTTTNPSLLDLPLMAQAPELFASVFAILIIGLGGIKLLMLWQHRHEAM